MAKSVKYSPTGAALMTVRKILSTLEIGDKITIPARCEGGSACGRGI